MKLLGANIETKLFEMDFGNDILDMAPETQATHKKEISGTIPN